MKKTILSLAALMLMAATVMTSCSNDLDEVAPVEEQSNVVTLTIALPDYEPATRVAVDGTTLKITGWENGDVVTLYNATPGVPDGEEGPGYPTKFSGDGIVFTYSSAAQEFSGTLPTGKTLADYNLAVYGGTAENSTGGININPTTWCSTDLKNVIMMGAIKDSEGKFTMKVINNVMKIDNQSGANVTVAWYGYDHRSTGNRYFKLASQVGTTDEEPMVWKGANINGQNHTDASAVPTFTLVNGAVNYVNFPMVHCYYNDDKIGLYKTDGTAVVTMKETGSISSNGSQTYAGKLIKFDTAYDGTTTGTAKATIGGSEVDVNWVQLWAGGPKFADRNVEGTMTFTQAIADPFTWGSNWCTPSKADLDELVKAASNDADKRNNAKVTCTYEQVEEVWGFTFTGKEDGYTNNSVFFPAKNVAIGSAAYWSGSASGVYGCVMYLSYDGNWGSYWYDYPKTFGYLVRPMLKN